MDTRTPAIDSELCMKLYNQLSILVITKSVELTIVMHGQSKSNILAVSDKTNNSSYTLLQWFATLVNCAQCLFLEIQWDFLFLAYVLEVFFL